MAKDGLLTEVTDLGVVRWEPKMNTSCVGIWRDGRPVLFVQGGSPGDGVRFGVLDARTGESLAQHHLTQIRDSLSMVTGPDGRVYIPGWGPEARVLVYDPQTDGFEDLGVAVEGETHICRMQVLPTGELWGGTYPNGHIFSWDPTTRAYTNHGQLGEGEWYARSVAHDGDHTLYVGTEGSARLFQYDLRTWRRSEILQPADMDPADYRIALMAWRGGLLFAQYSVSGHWHVWDPAAQEWIFRTPAGATSMPTELYPGTSKVYLADREGERLAWFDVATRGYGHADWDQQLTSKRGGGNLNLVDLGDPRGPHVIGMGRDRAIWHFHPPTGTGRMLEDAELPAARLTLRSLGVGPDDKVYVGYGFNSGLLTRWNPATEKFEHLTPAPGNQLHSQLVASDGTMWLGTYSNAVLLRYRPDQPYAWGHNARVADEFGDDMQDRLFGLAELPDGRIAIGGLGKRGWPHGILALHDPATGETVRHRELLPGHEIMALTTVGSTLYGATSIETPGLDPRVPDAVIFAFDTETDTLSWTAELPGVATVSKLLARRDGQLWAMTTLGDLRLFDPASRTVQQVVPVGEPGGNYAFATLNPSATAGSEGDGHWYGSTASGAMFRFDPETGAAQRLGEGEYLVRTSDDTLYWVEGWTNLVRGRLKP